MEKYSRIISKLPRQDSMQESKPRRRWRKRDQSVVENSQPYKPKIKRYPIPGEETAVPSASRGQKRRNTENEDDDQKVKRLMTQHTNQSDSDGLHNDKSLHDKSIDTVNLPQKCDSKDGRRVFERKSKNDSLQERGKKRKFELDHHSQEGIKRLSASPIVEESDIPNHPNSDDNIGYIPCKNSCVCKVGLSHKPTPIERRGYPQIVPLYKKLLQRRMLSTLNVVMDDCCERQCCNIWSGRRYSNQRFEAGYDPSNLRVDQFKWGVWKQKPEIQKDNNNNNYDDDDDWFW